MFQSAHEEFSLLPGAQRETIVRMQFDAQRRGYAAEFPGSEDYLLLWDGEPAGRMLLAEREGELRIVDIAVTAALRNQGIGTWALRVAADASRKQNKPLRLAVRRDNVGALRLYGRCGFAAIGQDELYVEMELKTAAQWTGQPVLP